MEEILVEIKTLATTHASRSKDDCERWLLQIDTVAEQASIQAAIPLYYQDALDRLSRLLENLPGLTKAQLALWVKIANKFDEQRALMNRVG